MPADKFHFRIGMGGKRGGPNYAVFTQYGVQVYPTNFVLDGNGKVIYRGIGFQEAPIRSALAKLGVK